MEITAQTKLITDISMRETLLKTMSLCNDVCNFLSKLCFEKKIFKARAIHREFYYLVRETFDVPSQMVIRSIAKVAAAYEIDQKTLREFRSLGSIGYDQRILTWHETDHISMTTIYGRIKKIPFVCGERHRKHLSHKRGESKLIYRNGEFFLHTTCHVPEKELVDSTEFLGVDLGIVNIATTSLGKRSSGAHLNSLRKRHKRLRKKLQSKGTKSAKRLLRKRRKKEQRFAKNVNHCISKEIVETAERHSLGIALENLEGVREATVRKQQRYALNSWAFYDLRQKIWYKACLAGVKTVLVEPEYTSQECSKCGYIAKSNRKSQSRFSCGSCGYTSHADDNAACVIASRAATSTGHTYLGSSAI